MKRIQSRIEKNRAFEVLTEAFRSSPGMTWMLKNPNSETAKKRILHFFYSEAKSKKGAFITSDRNGVIFYFPQHRKNFSLRSFYQKVYLILFVTGIKNGMRCLKYQRLIKKIRPKTGWVATLLACDSSHNGIKTAFEIKQEVFQLADVEMEMIYAETTSPRAKILYEISGYELYHSAKHPYADLTIWFYRRYPYSYSQPNYKNIA